MTSVFLLFSLLTPNLEQVASELFMPQSAEPPTDAIERMMAKFERQYEVERVVQTATSVFD